MRKFIILCVGVRRVMVGYSLLGYCRYYGTVCCSAHRRFHCFYKFESTSVVTIVYDWDSFKKS
jgi:hypothetical protein